MLFGVTVILYFLKILSGSVSCVALSPVGNNDRYVKDSDFSIIFCLTPHMPLTKPCIIFMFYTISSDHNIKETLDRLD
jgi:hypothetical protein